MFTMAASMSRGSGHDLRAAVTNFDEEAPMEHVSQQLAESLAVKMANLRNVWAYTMAVMIGQGLLTNEDVEWMRDQCIAGALDYVASSSGPAREFGVRGVADLEAMFKRVLPDDPEHEGSTVPTN